jgi:hypothetical protein
VPQARDTAPGRRGRGGLARMFHGAPPMSRSFSFVSAMYVEDAMRHSGARGYSSAGGRLAVSSRLLSLPIALAMGSVGCAQSASQLASPSSRIPMNSQGQETRKVPMTPCAIVADVPSVPPRHRVPTRAGRPHACALPAARR